MTASRAVVISPIAVVLLLVPVIGTRTASSEHLSTPAAFAASLAVDALAVAALFAFLQLRLSGAAYIHYGSDRKTVPVDWTAPGWSVIGDRLQEAGISPAQLHAVMAFSPGLNLSTVHHAQNPPGLLGRMALWTAPRRRPLMVIGVIVGVSAALISDIPSSAHVARGTSAHRAASWNPPGVLIVAGLTALLLTALYSVTVMIRRNITSPRLAIVIPSGWRYHFTGQADAAAALLVHEFSHLRHRDALQKRVMVTVGDWASLASVFSALMAASLAITGHQDAVLILPAFALMVAAAVSGVRATRQARRLFPLAQEVRADADVASHGFTARELRAGLTALHEVAPDSTLATRIAILTAEADGRLLPGFRAMVKLAGLGYLLPVVTLAAVALA